MVKVFNSPPNWPVPPSGWTPEPGWAPDPRWGVAPQGWQFWSEVDDQQVRADLPSSTLRVFISYRRADTRSHVNGLYDGLATRLPEASIFMDLDSIPAGVDFEEHIRDEISRCDVVLVVIGDEWLELDADLGARRIDHPDDFVRLEIESALQNPTVVVIPVLVEGARMPASTVLPEQIRRLARINALTIDDTRWRADISRLVTRIEEIESGNARRGTDTRRMFEDALRQPEAVPTPNPTPSFPAPGALPPRSQAWAAAPFTPLGATQLSASSPARQMSIGQVLVSLLMCLIPLASFGMLSFVPPLVAAAARVPPGTSRRNLRLAAAGLGVSMVIAFALIGASPVDGAGTVTGWQSSVGFLLMLACIVAGTWIAVAYWKPRPGTQRASLR